SFWTLLTKMVPVVTPSFLGSTNECLSSYVLPYRQRTWPHWHWTQSAPAALANDTGLPQEEHLRNSGAFSQTSISLIAGHPWRQVAHQPRAEPVGWMGGSCWPLRTYSRADDLLSVSLSCPSDWSSKPAGHLVFSQLCTRICS